MARMTSADPVGTPPEGGRWTWDGAWVRLPEDAPQSETHTPPVAPANEPNPANEE